jgi:hypothetical protein
MPPGWPVLTVELHGLPAQPALLSTATAGLDCSLRTGALAVCTGSPAAAHHGTITSRPALAVVCSKGLCTQFAVQRVLKSPCEPASFRLKFSHSVLLIRAEGTGQEGYDDNKQHSAGTAERFTATEARPASGCVCNCHAQPRRRSSAREAGSACGPKAAWLGKLLIGGPCMLHVQAQPTKESTCTWQLRSSSVGSFELPPSSQALLPALQAQSTSPDLLHNSHQSPPCTSARFVSHYPTREPPSHPQCVPQLSVPQLYVT